MTQAFNLSQFANKVNTSGQASLTTAVTGTLPIGNGGTGITTTPSNGQLLIGNGSGFTAATLTQGSNITITNSSGGITIAASGSAPTTAQVLSALTGMTANAVGSFCAGFTASVSCAIGATMAGSSLRGTSSTGSTFDPGFSGTWLNLGTSAFGTSNYSARSTWVRIS